MSSLGSATRKQTAAPTIAPPAERKPASDPQRAPEQPPTPAPASATTGAERVRQTLTHEEGRIRSARVENGVAVHPETGEVVWTKKGTKSKIKIPAEDLPKLRGMVFTHNHPYDVSFSPADIVMAATIRTPEIRTPEIRAVAKNTTYILRPPESGWKWTNARSAESAVKMAYSIGRMIHAPRSLVNDIRAGRVSEQEANYQATHQVIEHVAKTLGLYYERIQHEPSQS